MIRVCCALAVVVLAGCSSGDHASRGSPIPWVNRPRPNYKIPGPKLVRFPTTAPPCRPSQLGVTGGRSGVASGNRYERLVFINAGERTCLLRGKPTITADTPSGRRVLRPRHSNFGLVAANLPPGGHAYLDFDTSDCGCKCLRPRAVRYGNLMFALPAGGHLHTAASIVVDCWLAMSHFGLPERFAERKARPGTPGTLRARINLAPTVRTGATINYTVTLANPTEVAVSLRPCPSYTDGNARSFALNCDTVHAIAPHASVNYEMRILLPEKYTLAKIVWRLNTPTGPEAVAVARVTDG